MKILKIIAIGILSITGVHAQNTLLFKIEHPKWKTQSYVFGTMHVNSPSAFQFGNPVFEAIEACDYAAFELNLSNRSQQGIREDIVSDSNVMAAIEKIKDEFPKRLKAAGISEMELMQKGGTVYAELLKKMMNPPVGQENRTEAMDVFLQSYATHHGKKVLGIETIQEQLKFLLNFNLEIVMDSAVAFLKSPDWDKRILEHIKNSNQIQSVYEEMALSPVCAEVDKTPLTPWMNDLIYSRNDIMLERTYPLLEKNSVFIAVGAAHLCGEKGLIQLLKHKGCKVTPVKIGGITDAPLLIWNKNVLPDGSEIETLNSRLAKDVANDPTGLTYSASDTARVGLVHFEVDAEPGFSDIDYFEEEVAAPIEEGALEVMEVPAEVSYGEDHVGEAVFEGYEDSTRDESNNELAEVLAEKLGEALKKPAADTIHLTGRMGEFQVIKQVRFGFIEYSANFIKDENTGESTLLKLSGDPYWMNHPDILRFFTSYYRKP